MRAKFSKNDLLDIKAFTYDLLLRENFKRSDMSIQVSFEYNYLITDSVV